MTNRAEHRADAASSFEGVEGGWWSSLARCCGTQADRRNQIVFLAWTAGWMFAYTLAANTLQGDLLSESGPEAGSWAAWGLAALPNVLAIGTLVSYLRFLRMADELTRLIQIQGLAIGFGAWLFLSMGWELFEDAGAPPLADDFALFLPLAAMALGQLYLSRRYS